MTALKAVTAEMEVVTPFATIDDEKWYSNAVLIAVAMAGAEVCGLKQHLSGSDGRLENIALLDCFFAAPDDCFANAGPCGHDTNASRRLSGDAAQHAPAADSLIACGFSNHAVNAA